MNTAAIAAPTDAQPRHTAALATHPSDLSLPGTRVGSGRWPYSSAWPGCWGLPLVGVVLALNDPRAWTNTLSFTGVPGQQRVDDHVARCRSQGLLADVVPVAWDFSNGRAVRWESIGGLCTPEQDLARWRSAKAAELRRCRGLVSERKRLERQRLHGEQAASQQQVARLASHARCVAA